MYVEINFIDDTKKVLNNVEFRNSNIGEFQFYVHIDPTKECSYSFSDKQIKYVYEEQKCRIKMVQDRKTTLVRPDEVETAKSNGWEIADEIS